MSVAAGDMYYTVQQNGTVVAVNVTSQTVAYTLAPLSGFIYMLATDDGHLLVAGGPDLPNLHCFGNPVLCGTRRLIRAFNPQGKFLYSFVAHDGSFRYHRAWRLHGNHLYYMQGGINRGGTRGNFSYLNIETGEGRQLPAELSSIRASFVPGSDREMSLQQYFGDSELSNVAVFDYLTQKMLINVSHLWGNGYVGSDDTYYYFNNASDYANPPTPTLLLYSKNTKQLAYTLYGYESIGNPGTHTVTPLLSQDGQLLSFVNSRNNGVHVRLTIVNISTGMEVTQVNLWNAHNDGGEPLRLINGYLVVWASTFKVVNYLTGAVVSEVSTSCGGYCNLEALSDSGLVMHLGSGPSNDYRVKVRSLLTGEKVWQRDYGYNEPFSQAVVSSKNVWVVTNQATAEVWQF
ncbi:MAG: hypothetical protein COB65_12365 [Thalassobium sp.]|nr:MAG: hypothetical protein COB65_12365 [Thalassobium sp.]